VLWQVPGRLRRKKCRRMDALACEVISQEERPASCCLERLTLQASSHYPQPAMVSPKAHSCYGLRAACACKHCIDNSIDPCEEETLCLKYGIPYAPVHTLCFILRLCASMVLHPCLSSRVIECVPQVRSHCLYLLPTSC
jgi:hypothetical protein